MRQRFLRSGLPGLLLAGLILGGLALRAWSHALPPSTVTFQSRDGLIVLRRIGAAQWRIEAASPLDEAFAEGMLDGLDAAPSLIFRRAAAYGTLQALAGPGAAAADAWVQSVNLPARIQAAWDGLDAATQTWLQAYADGVNTAWRRGLPWSRRLLQPDPVAMPWRPQDSLAVAAGLALAHPGWMEAEISRAIRRLPDPLRASLSDPSWSAVAPVPDAPIRERVWWTWAAAGAAPEIGLFRGCREGAGFRLHAMAAPVLPFPWRAEWAGGELRLRWPGIPGALARISPSGGWWLQPTPGTGDPLDRLGELIQGIRGEAFSSSLWAWTAMPAAWPACSAARAIHREALLALPPEDWLQQRVHGMLRRWEGGLEARSAAALVYAVWREEALRAALQDRLGEEGLRRLLTRRPTEMVLTALLERGEGVWRSDREQALREAYRRALDWIGRHYGDLHTIWEWGKAHGAALGILGWPLRAEIPIGGDEQDLWPTPMDHARPYRTAFWPTLTVIYGSEVRIKTAPTPWWWPWP